MANTKNNTKEANITEKRAEALAKFEKMVIEHEEMENIIENGWVNSDMGRAEWKRFEKKAEKLYNSIEKMNKRVFGWGLSEYQYYTLLEFYHGGCYSFEDWTDDWSV